MVDTFQPRRLSCFRIRKRRHEDRMNQEKTKTPKPSQHDMGWKAQRTFPLLPVAGEIFLLTFPFYRTALGRTNPRRGATGTQPQLRDSPSPPADVGASFRVRGCNDLQRLSFIASFHSHRSASIGSRDDARYAGTMLAAMVTNAIPTSATTKVSGSPGCNPKRIALSKRAPASAAGRPKNVPSAHTTRLSRMIIQSTCSL